MVTQVIIGDIMEVELFNERNAFRPVTIKRKFIEVLRLLKARNRRTFEVFQTLTTSPSVNTNGEVCLP